MTATEWLPLVRRIAFSVLRKMPRQDYLGVEDLVAVGTIGLMQALRGYDQAKGRFETFAGWRIRGAMLDEFRELDHLSRSHRRELTRTGAKAPRVFQLDAEIREESGHSEAVLIDPGAQRDLDRVEISDIWEAAAQATTYVELQVLMMKYLDDLSWTAIGRTLGHSATWAAWVHSKAIAKLNRRLCA